MISIYHIEVWKDVPEFNGAIQISTLGEVRYTCNYWISGKGLKKLRTPTIKQKLDKDGYPVVCIYLSKKRYDRSIHRMSGLTFHENPENKKQVNHKDLNKLNSHYMNFEWMTPGENVRHSFANQVIKFNPPKGERQPKAKLTDEKAREIKHAIGSCRKLADIYGVHHSIIQGIKSGKRWPHIA